MLELVAYSTVTRHRDGARGGETHTLHNTSRLPPSLQCRQKGAQHHTGRRVAKLSEDTRKHSSAGSQNIETAAQLHLQHCTSRCFLSLHVHSAREEFPKYPATHYYSTHFADATTTYCWTAILLSRERTLCLSRRPRRGIWLDRFTSLSAAQRPPRISTILATPMDTI
jgi:hypothetical protein